MGKGTKRKAVIRLEEDTAKQKQVHQGGKKSKKQSQYPKALSTDVFDPRTGTVFSTKPEDIDQQLVEANIQKYLKNIGQFRGPPTADSEELFPLGDIPPSATISASPSSSLKPQDSVKSNTVSNMESSAAATGNKASTEAQVTFWQEVTDPKYKRSYYWNPSNNEVSWTLPANAVIMNDSDNPDKLAVLDSEGEKGSEELSGYYEHYAKNWYNADPEKLKEKQRAERKSAVEEDANEEEKKEVSESSTDTAKSKEDKELIVKSPKTNNKNDSQFVRLQVSSLSDEIGRKLKYLHVSQETHPELHLLSTQLEIRLSDWREGGISSQFLLNKLKAMAQEIQQYVESATPKGWSCDWDSATCRYFFSNKASGEVLWEFPTSAQESSTELNGDAGVVSNDDSTAEQAASPIVEEPEEPEEQGEEVMDIESPEPEAPPSIPTPSNGMVSQDMGNQDQPSVPPQSNQPPSMPPQPSGAVMNVSFQVQSQSASVTVPHTDGKGTSGESVIEAQTQSETPTPVETPMETPSPPPASESTGEQAEIELREKLLRKTLDKPLDSQTGQTVFGSRSKSLETVPLPPVASPSIQADDLNEKSEEQQKRSKESESSPVASKRHSKSASAKRSKRHRYSDPSDDSDNDRDYYKSRSSRRHYSDSDDSDHRGHSRRRDRSRYSDSDSDRDYHRSSRSRRRYSDEHSDDDRSSSRRSSRRRRSRSKDRRESYDSKSRDKSSKKSKKEKKKRKHHRSSSEEDRDRYDKGKDRSSKSSKEASKKNTKEIIKPLPLEKSFVPAKYKPKGKQSSDQDDMNAVLTPTQLQMYHSIASATGTYGAVAYPVVDQQYFSYPAAYDPSSVSVSYDTSAAAVYPTTEAQSTQPTNKEKSTGSEQEVHVPVLSPVAAAAPITKMDDTAMEEGAASTNVMAKDLNAKMAEQESQGQIAECEMEVDNQEPVAETAMIEKQPEVPVEQVLPTIEERATEVPTAPVAAPATAALPLPPPPPPPPPPLPPPSSPPPTVSEVDKQVKTVSQPAEKEEKTSSPTNTVKEVEATDNSLTIGNTQSQPSEKGEEQQKVNPEEPTPPTPVVTEKEPSQAEKSEGGIPVDTSKSDDVAPSTSTVASTAATTVSIPPASAIPSTASSVTASSSTNTSTSTTTTSSAAYAAYSQAMTQAQADPSQAYAAYAQAAMAYNNPAMAAYYPYQYGTTPAVYDPSQYAAAMNYYAANYQAAYGAYGAYYQGASNGSGSATNQQKK